MKKQILTRALGLSGLRQVLGRAFPWTGVLTLNYHRIGDGKASLFDRGLWSASLDAFDEQIRFLKSHVDVISPADLSDVLNKRRGRHVMITFDDGYADNYQAAFPILRQHGIPATFFIATGFLDHPRLPWWDEIAWMVRNCPMNQIKIQPWIETSIIIDKPDREQAIRTLLRTYKSIRTNCTNEYLDALGKATGQGRYNQAESKSLWMTWEMIREMRNSGMTIGGHTVNHPILARMPLPEQQAEISNCARRLTEELGEPMQYFSYPVGNQNSFNDETRECLRKERVKYSFSYYGGVAQFGSWDDYAIPRVAVETYITRDWFRAIVAMPHTFA